MMPYLPRWRWHDNKPYFIVCPSVTVTPHISSRQRNVRSAAQEPLHNAKDAMVASDIAGQQAAFVAVPQLPLIAPNRTRVQRQGLKTLCNAAVGAGWPQVQPHAPRCEALWQALCLLPLPKKHVSDPSTLPRPCATSAASRRWTCVCPSSFRRAATWWSTCPAQGLRQRSCMIQQRHACATC